MVGKKTSFEKNNFLSSQFPSRSTSARGGWGVGRYPGIPLEMPLGGVIQRQIWRALTPLLDAFENAFEDAFEDASREPTR